MLQICEWQQLGHSGPPQGEVVSSAGSQRMPAEALSIPASFQGRTSKFPSADTCLPLPGTRCREIEREVLLFELHVTCRGSF
jgi:hypothetical protein